MSKRLLERRRASDVQAAVDRAMAYAAENKVPLTVERLSAELQMPVTALRRYLAEDYEPPARGRAAVDVVRRAAEQATASVIEYALTRGTSQNMHMMYLKQYAGYGGQENAEGEPVVFTGEREI